jgi:hypothetical protein
VRRCMAASNPGGRARDERLELIWQEGWRTGGDAPWAGGELSESPLLSDPRHGGEGFLA